GTGRTGRWFAHQTDGVVPDVVTLAKGLGGGLPIGACIALGDAAGLFGPGEHGTTFGGNPVCAAAAVAVLETIDRDGLLEHVHRIGEVIADGVEGSGHPAVDHVRGRGLLLGIVLTRPLAKPAVEAARDRGYLINAPRPDVLRLAPPLILSEQQARGFVAALPGLLDVAAHPTEGTR